MELRKRSDNQYAIGLDGQNSVEINRQIQLQVVREFGFSDMYISVIQSAKFLYPNNPLMKTIPNYVRFNRSKPGHLQVGMQAPDCEIYTLDGVSVNLLAHKLPGRPLVVAAGSIT